MLNQWINNKYLEEEEINRVRNNFLKSKPYSNFNLQNFFNKSKLAKLKNGALKEKYELVDKDLFTLSHTNDLITSKNPVIKEFYKLLSSKDFISLMEKITGENLSNKIDMQSHSMTHGHYLLFHDDVVDGRKIAYIVYLADFNANDGGALRLYDIKKPLNPLKKIYPKFNSFACFKVSSKSLHDVEEIKSKKQRLTIGGWFYGD